MTPMTTLASIPSPSANGFHVGPLFFHFYGLCYVVGITAAVILTRKLWREKGGDPDLVYTVALWGVPAGILGARLDHQHRPRIDIGNETDEVQQHLGLQKLRRREQHHLSARMRRAEHLHRLALIRTRVPLSTLGRRAASETGRRPPERRPAWRRWRR